MSFSSWIELHDFVCWKMCGYVGEWVYNTRWKCNRNAVCRALRIAWFVPTIEMHVWSGSDNTACCFSYSCILCVCCVLCIHSSAIGLLLIWFSVGWKHTAATNHSLLSLWNKRGSFARRNVLRFGLLLCVDNEIKAVSMKQLWKFIFVFRWPQNERSTHNEW